MRLIACFDEKLNEYFAQELKGYFDRRVLDKWLLRMLDMIVVLNHS